MSIDQQIQDYFHARSGDVTTSTTPVGTIVERGRRRRRRRTAARVGAVGGVVALAGVVAAQGFRGSGPQGVETVDQASVPTDLEWTVVTPERGISEARQTVAAPDGSIYAVATAPGGGRLEEQGRPALWRSTDQRDWAEVALPDGLTPSGIAAAGDRIYAVGTSPSGGDVDRVELASTATGSTAADWDAVEVPLDLPAREAASGLDVSVRAVRVAHLGDRAMVAVSTRAQGADLQPFVPDARPGWSATDATAEGLLGIADECAADEPGERGEHAAAGGPGTSTAGTVGPSGSIEGDGAAGPACAGLELLPWDQVDATDAERRELIGETVVLAAGSDGTFETVLAAPGAGVAALQVDDGGVWMAGELRGIDPGVQLWRSSDGTTWTPIGAPRPGWVIAQGVVQGRAAFGVAPIDGTGRVAVARTDSSGVGWAEIPAPAGTWSSGLVSFGPLGAATVFRSEDGAHQYVVHSRDLAAWSTVPFEPGPRSYATGVTVTADAITVRLSDRNDLGEDDVDTPSTPRLFVGTPR